MDTQPPQDPRRLTWVDKNDRYWRVERIGGRWQLSPVLAGERDVATYRLLSEQVRAIDAAREAPPAE